jgi:uncharacterized cupin superfamily protein
MADPKRLVRTRSLDWSQVFHGRHPFNPASDMRIVALSDQIGMQRAHLKLIRIAPGAESFIPHAHSVEEEYVFILEGQGSLTLDGEATPVGPGDYIGFPIDGVVHHLTNTGEADLVYLSGGERSPVEVARMPTLGKVAVFKDNAVSFYPEDGGERLTMAEWIARARIEAP